MVLKKTLSHFPYALIGLRIAWLEEYNFRFHVVFAILTLLLGWYLGLSKIEFIIVIFMIGFDLQRRTRRKDIVALHLD